MRVSVVFALSILISVETKAPLVAQENTGLCDAIVVNHFGYGGNFFASDRHLPSSTTAPVPFGHVVYADTIDLDCDGANDLVVQGRLESTDSRQRPLMLMAWVSRADGWVSVLSSASPVTGPERIAIAAPLVSTDRRDVVLVGADEGGIVPRVFVWTGDTLEQVEVPQQYYLRGSTEWGPDCRRKLNPQILDGGRIALLRETIPRTSMQDHGASCALPVDTLVIRGSHVERAPRGEANLPNTIKECPVKRAQWFWNGERC